VLAAVVWVSAGDLNPPPGPITPTQRTPIGVNTTPGDATSLFKIAARLVLSLETSPEVRAGLESISLRRRHSTSWGPARAALGLDGIRVNGRSTSRSEMARSLAGTARCVV
jgi:hypothetical protein